MENLQVVVYAKERKDVETAKVLEKLLTALCEDLVNPKIDNFALDQCRRSFMAALKGGPTEDPGLLEMIQLCVRDAEETTVEAADAPEQTEGPTNGGFRCPCCGQYVPAGEACPACNREPDQKVAGTVALDSVVMDTVSLPAAAPDCLWSGRSLRVSDSGRCYSPDGIELGEVGDKIHFHIESSPNERVVMAYRDEEEKVIISMWKESR